MKRWKRSSKIATIQPRTIQLKLSNADCNRIAEKAGAYWSYCITVTRKLYRRPGGRYLL